LNKTLKASIIGFYMGYVDFILNLAGLLLWLNWRSNRFDPLVKRLPATLMGTLRPAAPKRLRRWHLLAILAGLLLLRALIYWWIGSQKNLAGKVNLGVVVLWFSNSSHWSGFCHMLLFSFFSFGLMLGIFYVCLLPLSLLAGPPPMQALVAIPLGRVDGWPRWAKAILPFFVTAILWELASWLLGRLQILPPVSPACRFQQSLVIAASSYLLWQFPLGAILLLHLLNSYIYFGKHPLWNYARVTSQKLLQPLGKIPLRLGKVDFAPLLLLALLFLAAELAARGSNWLYARLPF
jgi:uncharacterized protein YggT (Ycf19 family)